MWIWDRHIELLIYGIVRDENMAVGWDDCVESGVWY